MCYVYTSKESLNFKLDARNNRVEIFKSFERLKRAEGEDCLNLFRPIHRQELNACCRSLEKLFYD